MNSDIRVNTGFLHHHKTRLLRRRLGADAVLSLQQLWCYTAEYKPNGDLSGMSDDAIEAAAEWPGDPGALIQHLTDRETLFLDGEKGNRTIHDWIDHNPYAAGSTSRSDKQRFNRLAGSYPHIYNQLREKGVDSLNSSDYQSLTNGQRTVEQIVTNRTTPYPLPSPLPVPLPSTVDQVVDSSVLSPDFEPERITSDTPLPAVLQHEWDQLLAVYPAPTGIVKGKDKAVRLFARSAERKRILRNAGHYAATAPEMVMNLDRFVHEAYRDYDNAPLPSGGAKGSHSPRDGLIVKLKDRRNKGAPGMPPAEEALLQGYIAQGQTWKSLQDKVAAGMEI